MSFLVDTDLLQKRLEHLPCIRERLNGPLSKLRRAKSFPNLHISDSQIIGFIANSRYEHIELTLQKMEGCFAHGWNQPKILRTTSMREIGSYISEVYLTDHLIRNSTSVCSLDENKGSERVPDLLVSKNGRSMVVEIYSPRDWYGLSLFQEELRRNIINMDTAYDFNLVIGSKLLKEFTPDMRLIVFNPWKFSEKYNNDSIRNKVMDLICSRIEDELLTGCSGFRTSYTDKTNNIRFQIDAENVQPTNGSFPCRRIEFYHPCLSGYAPEGMFKEFVLKKLKNKISLKQTSAVKGNIRALFISTDMLGYSDEFFDEGYYQQQFANSLSSLDVNNIGEDLIVFFNMEKSKNNCIQIPAFLMKPGTDIEAARDLVAFTHEYERLAAKVYFCKK